MTGVHQRDVQPQSLAADALAGLWQDPPTLPTKWLYDERGSRLFDEITRLPEYYPTRRETTILTAHGSDIASASGARMLIELGSGTSTKTRLLITAFLTHHFGIDHSGTQDTRVQAARPQDDKLRYVPVDVSAEILTSSAMQLSHDYPQLDVETIIADFTASDLHFPSADGPRMVIFLGGTVGNLDETQRHEFFGRLADALNPGDYFLLGVDLVKDAGRLIAAYDDKSGVTADFNRNMIEVLRAGLDATGLYADDFDHVARWNVGQHRIEMWLRARRDINAYFGALDRVWQLEAGREIRTEISTKFEFSSLVAELAEVGLLTANSWTDPAGDFLVILSRR